MLKRILGKRRFIAKKAVSPKTEMPDKPLAKFNPSPKSAEEIKVAQTSAAPFASSPCGVTINSVDLCGNKIVTTLSGPSSNNDTFKLAVFKSSDPSTYTVILNTTRTPGTYTDPFDLSGLATDVAYDTVEAVYVCGGANNVDDFSYKFKILGVYRQSQYNTPHEGDPTCQTGGTKNVCFTDTHCVYTSGTLFEKFRSQTKINGSGISLHHGILNYPSGCSSPPTACNGLTSFRANVKSIVPACGSKYGVSNTTVAAPYDNKTRRFTDPDLNACGINICLIGAGTSGTNIKKVITDHCPECNGKKQLDNYTTVGVCSHINDLGNYVTVKIPS